MTDPPEHGGRRPRPAASATPCGDPPAAAFPPAARPGGAGPPLRLPASAAASRRPAHHDHECAYDDDLASVQTAPPAPPPGSGGAAAAGAAAPVPFPASALRRAKVAGGMHDERGVPRGGGGGGYASEELRALRGQRLAATRRGRSRRVDSSPPARRLTSLTSSSSVASSSSTTAAAASQSTATSPPSLPSSLGARVLRHGWDAAAAVLGDPRALRRARPARALVALLALGGVLRATLRPPPRLRPASAAANGGRVLQDTHARAGDGAHCDDFDQRRRRAATLPPWALFEEPAHARMCRAIVQRLDAYDAGVALFDRAVFTEGELVCRDRDAP